jgi:hypothetical protein
VCCVITLSDEDGAFVDNNGSPCFIVRVNFNGTMFGSFSQWVVFDFSTQPVLVRKLSVEVGI